MVSPKSIDEFLILRCGLNAKGAKGANFREKKKFAFIRTFRVTLAPHASAGVRVKNFLTLEKPWRGCCGISDRNIIGYNKTVSVHLIVSPIFILDRKESSLC